MNKSVIVYGPQACGKTRNAERIRKHFGLDRVVDDWDGRRAPYERNAFEAVGVLYITNMQPEDIARTLKFDLRSSRRCLSFAEIVQQINDAIPLTEPVSTQDAWPDKNRKGVYLASVNESTFYRYWDGRSFHYGGSSPQSAESRKGTTWPRNSEIFWRGLAEEPIVVA